MAWRFKVSKYKNTTPIAPKPEQWIRDLAIGSFQTYGRNITASAKFLAFNWDSSGNSISVLPLHDCGRKSKSIPLIYAHSDTVTDIDFSPFDDHLLVTGSQDCTIKLWSIPEHGLESPVTEPQMLFSYKQRRVENVGFHPTVDFCIYSTSYSTLTLWDLTQKKSFISDSNQHKDVIQSVSWREDGTLCSSTCKDKIIRLLDPRSADFVINLAPSHQNLTDSRVVWLGDSSKVLTTGFDATRMRQVFIRDIRNFSNVEKTLEFSCSTGILLPLYDADTKLVFLAGKGDTSITLWEALEKEPFLIEGLRHNGEQTKNVCLVPKRALNFMQAEVSRVLQLTSNSIIPIMYQIPRKTYRDFHSDLYPDIFVPESSLTAVKWIQNDQNDLLREKISINPQKSLKVYRGALLDAIKKTDSFANCNGVHIEKIGTKDETDQVPKPLPRLSKNGFVNVTNNSKNVSCDDTKPPVAKPRATTNTFAFNSCSSPVTNSTATNTTNKLTNYSVANFANFKPRLGPKPFIAQKSIETPPVNHIEENHKESNGFTAENNEISEPETATKAPFERHSLQRNSIAERRRLYENSESIQIQDPSPVPLRRKDTLTKSLTTRKPFDEIVNNNDSKIIKQQSLDLTQRRTLTVFGRVSKFRHLKGTPAHKSQCIDNIRNVSRQVPGECDGFQANFERVAVPLSGQGGKIAIFELSKPGRLPDGVIASLVNGVNIMDFQWDPFDPHRLAVACDDGTVKLWQIPASGLTEPTNQPQFQFNAHFDKIYFVKFHPLAKNVIATGAADYNIKIWNLDNTEMPKIVLTGHCDVIFHFSWSPCGSFAATVSKDTKIRLYTPRELSEPISETFGLPGTRGARLVWALNGQFFVLLGFDKVSQRQIVVFDVNQLKFPLNSISLDVSPSILVPFYDEDSSTLFLTGKGDSTIYAFEIILESPYICPLSHHRCSSLHQGLSFLQKNACDVSSVEFAKALRLTNTSIEPLSFTVPRIKNDLFQDDLFPDTKVLWQPTMTSNEWFDGQDKLPSKISLKPTGMESLSDSKNLAYQPQTLPSQPARSSEPNNEYGVLKPKFGKKGDKNSMVDMLKKAFNDIEPDEDVEQSDTNSDDWN